LIALAATTGDTRSTVALLPPVARHTTAGGNRTHVDLNIVLQALERLMQRNPEH
jgi:hypothetical protein